MLIAGTSLFLVFFFYPPPCGKLTGLANWKMAICSVYDPLTMVIFHSDVNVYQRVLLLTSLDKTSWSHRKLSGLLGDSVLERSLQMAVEVVSPIFGMKY